jgi:hypothetical protein
LIDTNTLLDAAKRAQSIPSDYRLCRVMGVTDHTLYNYRHGRTPDDERARRLAEMAGLHVGFVLVCMAAERAKDDETRRHLLDVAQTIAAVHPSQTVDILSLQHGTPNRLEMPMNTGFGTMGHGVPEYTLEKVCIPTPAHVAGLGILAAGAWISSRRARLLRASSSH